MIKKIYIIALTLCLLVFCVACDSSSFKAYTFSVDTGESVKVKLDTSDGYNISSDVPFVITQDETVLSQGSFILGETYEQYVAAAKKDKDVKVLDSGTINKTEYIFWSYNNAEYFYAILLPGGNTGIILNNEVSEESAKECFTRLTFSTKKQK